MALVCLVSLVVRLPLVREQKLDFDEGVNLMVGALAGQGHTPYTQTFVGIPPLATLMMELGTTLFGSGAAARYVMLAYGLLGVGALFWLVRRQSPHNPTLAALLAGGFLSFGAHYLVESTTLWVEVPALAVALLSVLLLEIFFSRRSKRWLLLSGMGFALSLALKLYVIFLPVLVGIRLLGWIVAADRTRLAQPSTWWKLTQLAAVWVSGVVVVVGLFALIYNPAAMFEQLVMFRLAMRQVTESREGGLEDVVRVLREGLIPYLPLAAGAVSGVVLMKRRGPAVTWALWLVLAGMTLASSAPLRPRYLVMLLPPLAALSGMAVAAVTDRLSWQPKPATTWLKLGLSGMLVGSVLLEPVRSVVWLPTTDAAQDTGDHASEIAFLQRTTAPDDCLVVEDLRFALEAGRRVPPNLSETSRARLSVGWLTVPQIIEAADRQDCAALVYGGNDHFDDYLPQLRQAARQLYSLQLEFNSPETAYAVKMDTHRPPAQAINRSLGGQVTLNGVDVTPAPWHAGQQVVVSSYWQAQRRIPSDYKVFVHLLDQQNRTVATFDHDPFEAGPDDHLTSMLLNPRYLEGVNPADFSNYPAAGLIPTRLWVPGNVLKETITITWPAAIPIGDYVLVTGMYDEATMARLEVTDQLPGGDMDAIPIAAVQVRP